MGRYIVFMDWKLCGVFKVVNMFIFFKYYRNLRGVLLKRFIKYVDNLKFKWKK